MNSHRPGWGITEAIFEKQFQFCDPLLTVVSAYISQLRLEYGSFDRSGQTGSAMP
ncbi:MAG: hypothetical protein AAGM33_01595 [Pseudomonadota bacterium]